MCLIHKHAVPVYVVEFVYAAPQSVDAGQADLQIAPLDPVQHALFLIAMEDSHPERSPGFELSLPVLVAQRVWSD
jgi:hypothetical protein